MYYKHFTPNQSPKENDILLTILAGVAVFIVGQLILEFILKPRKEYKNIKNEISNKLKYYSNFITNPTDVSELIVKEPDHIDMMFGGTTKEKIDFDRVNKLRLYEKYIHISDEIRKLSCDLEVKYYDNFTLFRKFTIKEEDAHVKDAVSRLYRISNSLFLKEKSEANIDDIEEIKRVLNLRR